MKNIHVLPTEQPSRIYLIKSNNKLGITSNNPEFTENFGSGTQNQNLFITSDEEIKEGDWFYLNDAKIVVKYIDLKPVKEAKKIILTTDQDLIKDGVQAIDDEFLEWFVKNPNCESVEVSYEVLKPFQSEEKGYLIHCPDNEVLEEPKQETIREVVKRYYEDNIDESNIPREHYEWEIQDLMIGFAYQWQQEQDKNKYSEKEVLKLWNWLNDGFIIRKSLPTREELIGWFEQFKNK
jgi:hypothetical protein